MKACSIGGILIELREDNRGKKMSEFSAMRLMRALQGRWNFVRFVSGKPMSGVVRGTAEFAPSLQNSGDDVRSNKNSNVLEYEESGFFRVQQQQHQSFREHEDDAQADPAV